MTPGSCVTLCLTHKYLLSPRVITDTVHLRGDPKAASPSRKPPALVWGVRAPTSDCRALRAKSHRKVH